MSRTTVNRFVLLLSALLFGAVATVTQASLFSQLTGADEGPLDVERAYRFSAQQERADLVRLDWTIEDGYYLYRDKIKITVPDNMVLLDSQYGPSQPKDDPLFGQVQVYYQQAGVALRLKSLASTPADGVLTIEYQGCWEGGICYPPVRKTLSVAQVPLAVDDWPGDFAMTGTEAQGPETAGASAMGELASLSLTDQQGFSRVLSSGNLVLTLMLFLLAGLGLSLTPCVFPMVPILASVIAGQTDTSTGRAFVMSVVYVLSMAVTYTLAGVFAGLFGENLQAAFQNTWVIAAFSLLFVVFAGAMFGFYHVEMPHGLQNRLNRISRSRRGGEVAGVAVMGFLSALIVGPCVAAPLAGALIYIGQTGDPLLGGAALFMLSLGMGLPLILIGTSAGRWMPAAGPWMNVIKQGFGVLMLLMAVWMLDRVVPVVVTMILTGMILVVVAIYLRALDGLPDAAGGWSRMAKGVGVLLLIYGGALLLGAVAGNRSLVYPLRGVLAAQEQQTALPRFAKVTSVEALQPLLQQAKSEGRPVLLDFYADWCVSCQELEFFVFADRAVQQQMERFTLIKVDVTANDQASKALNQRYQVIGPPALVFYDQQGNLLSERMLVGVPSAEDFAAHLSAI